MGIVFSGMFGFGLVIFTKVETDQHLSTSCSAMCWA